jgi:hypothetical protein
MRTVIDMQAGGPCEASKTRFDKKTVLSIIQNCSGAWCSGEHVGLSSRRPRVQIPSYTVQVTLRDTYNLVAFVKNSESHPWIGMALFRFSTCINVLRYVQLSGRDSTCFHLQAHYTTNLVDCQSQVRTSIIRPFSVSALHYEELLANSHQTRGQAF